jgi:hypothetical protein
MYVPDLMSLQGLSCCVATEGVLPPMGCTLTLPACQPVCLSFGSIIGDQH